MFISKSICLAVSCLIGLQTPLTSAIRPHAIRANGPPYFANSTYPNTTIAGVTVIDTPIVRAAREYSNKYGSDAVFKHAMRAWLFGSLIINGNDTLKNSVDLEIQAVSALLHDLGWDQTPGSPIISNDKRFEVDGAIAARQFLAENGDESWDARRTQLVWDAIALHTTRTIGYFKEIEVQITSMGISVDYDGLKPGVTNESYAAIVKELPNFDLKDATNNTFIWFCASKPAVTYDTNLQPWGERYVANYSTKGNLRIDKIFENL